MTVEHRKQVEELFELALEHKPAERSVWLYGACGDAALRAEVARLLAAHERAEGILDSSAPDLAGLLESEQREYDSVEAIGRVGPYRLVREIGRGGMGTVFLAERDDAHFRHRAAVKVLRRGLDTDDLVRRFVAERQILATLQHPNIARLLDGGVTDDGRPYYVMEYVAGEPLDAYCDRRRLSLDERLRLFAVVARAVHYAHRNLVVHRDLKPSNILVADDGEVKLLDFGIAKLLDPEGVVSQTVALTRTGLRVMTPEYASPEQVRGDSVTTATDVYGLGLVLYELVSGHRPYRLGGRSLAEIERIVCEEEPPRPSVAVTRVHELGAGDTTVRITPESVSEARGTTPARLRRALAGDVDRIVACAIRKEPERRYESAEQLATDLDRYLRGEPVAARGDSPAYRARKFVSRHRWGVAAAGAFVALLVGYAVTATVQANQVRSALAQARTEAAKAEQVTHFTMGLFEAWDPTAARGDTVTAHELLARGVERAERLDGQPLVQAQMLDVLGQVYYSLGAYSRAQPLLERSLAMRRRLLGDRHLDVADGESHLGELLRTKGDFRAGEPHLRRALTLHRELLGAEHVTVANDLHELGTALMDGGDYAGGEPLYREALAMRRKLLGPEHPDVAESLMGLSYVMTMKGDLAAAEQFQTDALAIYRKAYGDAHPMLALTLSNLAATLDRRGDYERSLAVNQEALAMRRKLFGDEHPSIAISLANMGVQQFRRGNYEGAEHYLREAIALNRKLLGDENPATATAVYNLATLLSRRGRYAEAEPMLREVLAVRRKVKGEEHTDIAAAMQILAGVVQHRGRPAEAEALYGAALSMRRRTQGPEHPDVAKSLHGFGELQRDLRNYAAADTLLQQAVALRRKLLGDAHPDVAQSVRSLIAVHERAGRPDRANAYRTEYRDILARR